MLRPALVLWTGLALVLAGCQSGNSKNSNVALAATMQKPVVTVVPVVDRSHSDLNWNLSQELTQAVQQNLLKHGNFHLMGPDKVALSLKKLGSAHDPFGENIEWTKRLFPQDEFVVFMELVKHDEIPLSKGGSPQDSPAELVMTVRLCVIDLRGSQPKVVLQELVHDTQHIPKQFNKANFDQVPWGNETFDVSPLGIAHAQLTKELTHRIEEYILLSGTR
jgi:hypothetical protein